MVNLMTKSEITKFIERNNLGYTLGNTVRAIIYAKNPEYGEVTKDDNSKIERHQLKYLKDARLFLNYEIKRLSKRI